MPTSHSDDFVTPAIKPSGVGRLLANPGFLALGAQIFALISRWIGGPIRFGGNVLVGRHADAVDVLQRDLEFRIGPINAAKMEAVNGPFILGLDRGEKLVTERATLYQALAKVDLKSLRAGIEQEATSRVALAGDALDVVERYARPIAAATARALLGIKPSDDARFMNVSRAMFGYLFFDLKNDPDVAKRAVEASHDLRRWFDGEIVSRRQSGDHGSDMMGALLSDPAVPDTPEGNDLVRRTLGGMLVGSIDTTTTCIAKIVTIIGQDKSLAAGIAADVDNPARLHGWCWEALRQWPHNPIVLRSAAVDTRIAGVDIRVGDKIFVVTQAAMLDASVFPDPQVMNPARPTGPYLHLGGGLHSCAGRDINAFQIPMLVGALVGRGIKSVGPIDYAGPFPAHLTVTFNRMAS